MKNRLRRNLRSKESSEVSKLVPTGRRKIGLEKKASKSVLPDQQQEKLKNGYHNTKPCRVRINRLKLREKEKDEDKENGVMQSNITISTVKQCRVRIKRLKLKEKEKDDDKERGVMQSNSTTGAVEQNRDHSNNQLDDKLKTDLPKANTRSENTYGNDNPSFVEEIIDLTQNDSVDQAKESASKRYLFRNPRLSLTKRKALELGLRKSLTYGTENTRSAKSNNIDNSKLFEIEENSTMHARTTRSRNKACYPSNEGSKPLYKNIQSTSSEKGRNRSEMPNSTNKQNDDNNKSNKKTKGLKNKPLNSEESSSERDIYDFFSTSQTSEPDVDKHKDPAADIIKKLIDQGKVAVKNRKGKPIVVKKKKKTTSKKYRELPKKTQVKLKSKIQFQPIQEEEETEQFNCNFDDDFNENNELIQMPSETSKKEDNEITIQGNRATVSADQGTFSNLARSVLMQQINQKNPPRISAADKNKLLEITQRHISTPLQKSRVSLLTDTADFSPIPHRTATNADKHFRRPSVTAINFNASYMPSFSHDVTEIQQNQHNSDFPKDNNTIREQASKEADFSSFSSNDSNAENMPPPKQNQPASMNDQNDIIFNARQNLNPRRTLKNRSPLKAINIIDVVIFPPYAQPIVTEKNDKTDKNEEPPHQISALQEYSNENKSESELHEKSICQNEETGALFGFEEYLNEIPDDLHNESNNTTTASTTTLHRRLKKLRKWRPDVSSYNTGANSSTITKNIFGDDALNKRKGQYDLRNMLCSTMINEPSKKIQESTVVSLAGDNSDDSDENLSTNSDKNDAVDLFGDPESTFDQKSLHRTYERPFRRKRKLLHQYSVVLDSEDESEHENEHNTSATSVTKRCKKNRANREANSDSELDKFATEFNSMIKDAEEYELIVE